MARIPDCHPEKKYGGHGLCINCYQRWKRTDKCILAPCHPDRPMYAKGLCNNCYQAEHADRPRNAERERTRRANWTPEQKAAERARLDKLPSNWHKARWKRIGCINPPERMPSDVSCEVCGNADRPIHLDHDHSTGLFRGWLCNLCNQGMGQFKDNVSVMLKAIEYLQRAR
jgi:hypothetical protein